MSTLEHYLRAQDSSDLADHAERAGDVDWVRASGMVARQHECAMSVWRVIELGDYRALRPAFDNLMRLCAGHGIDTHPAETVSDVLAWMMEPTCPSCSGRGFELIPGTPTLSDRACGDCGGTGQRAPAWDDDAKALYDLLKQEQANAAAAIARKMRD